MHLADWCMLAITVVLLRMGPQSNRKRQAIRTYQRWGIFAEMQG